MDRYSFLILMIAGIAILSGSAGELPGCAPAPPRGMWARIEDENALIVWQPETQTEHFIRRATFNSTANDFGFLVPTPSQPELGEVDSEKLFDQLGQITAPRHVEEIRRVLRVREGVGAAPDAMPSVRVIAEQNVAGMDAVVLQADNPDDLGKWLADHEYQFRPELRDWLEKYTSDKWFITAFKISAATEASQSQEQELTSKAVRMTFQTDTPFYPYREPVDMRDHRSQNRDRFLRLFVLAPAQLQATLGRTPRPWRAGEAVWSNLLKESQTEYLDGLLKLPQSLGKDASWWLTEFEDRSSPRMGTDELFFSPSQHPKTLERAPIVHVVDVYYESRWDLLCANPIAFCQEYPGWPVLGVVGLITIAVVLWIRWKGRVNRERGGPSSPAV